MQQDSWVYVVVSTVIFGLCFVVTGCLVCRHLFLVCRQWRDGKKATDKDSDTWFDQRVIHYGTLISAFSFWTIIALALAMRLFTFARATGLYPCNAQPLLYMETFSAAKCAMYAVFVARIHVCFDNSVYAYSKRTIRGMYAAIAVAFVLFACSIPLGTAANWEHTHYAANGRHVTQKGDRRSMDACVAHVNKALLSAMVVFDVGFSVLVVGLFTRPLRAMFKQSRAIHSLDSMPPSPRRRTPDPEQAEFELLPLKCFVVSGVAIASTLLAMLLSAATGMGVLMTVDNCVNVGCLLAMTGHWRVCYWRVCGPLLRCLSKSPFLGANDSANIAILNASFLLKNIASEQNTT